MCEDGYDSTLVAILTHPRQDKLKKLKGDYRRKKDVNKQTGNKQKKKKKSKFFDKMTMLNPSRSAKLTRSTSTAELSRRDVGRGQQ